jgi:predicted nuclease of predicted toxin-antitoxin system
LKLLFDQNLSRKLPRQLGDIYPDSQHVVELNLAEASDSDIWEYAKENGFTIVSKDTDFQQRSLLYGSPPKFIWLRLGNCSTPDIEALLRRSSPIVHTFLRDLQESHLILH